MRDSLTWANASRTSATAATVETPLYDVVISHLGAEPCGRCDQSGASYGQPCAFLDTPFRHLEGTPPSNVCRPCITPGHCGELLTSAR